MIRFCTACDASNPDGNAYCENCGAALEGGSGTEGQGPLRPATTPRRRRGRSLPEAPRSETEKRHARQGQHRIAAGLAALNRVRLFFGGIAFLAGALFALTMAVTVLGWSELRDEDPELRIGLVVADLIYGTGTAVAILGLTRAQRNGLPWAYTLAGLLTINAVLGPALASIGLAAAAWATIAPIMQLEKLRAADPDHPAWSNIVEGEKSSTLRRREHNARKRAWSDVRTAAVLAVVLILAVPTILFGRGIVAAMTSSSSAASSRGQRDDASVQPDTPLAPTLQRFENAWRNADFEAMGRLYPRTLRSRAERLPRRFESRGMSAPLPELGRARVRNYRAMAQMAVYETSAGDVELIFEFADGEWLLAALRLPR